MTGRTNAGAATKSLPDSYTIKINNSSDYPATFMYVGPSEEEYDTTVYYGDRGAIDVIRGSALLIFAVSYIPIRAANGKALHGREYTTGDGVLYAFSTDEFYDPDNTEIILGYV